MLTFHTARLRLPELTPDLMQARLNLAPDVSGFTHTLNLDGHDHLIGVPATWPGDALPLLPHLLAAGGPSGQFVLVRRQDRLAIGLIGQKGDPDGQGDLEIGYGLNPDARGEGYATEALRALLPHWHDLPGVRRVTAFTAPHNPASARVLQKAGFTHIGQADDPDGDDGPLLWWASR